MQCLDLINKADDGGIIQECEFDAGNGVKRSTVTECLLHCEATLPDCSTTCTQTVSPQTPQDKIASVAEHLERGTLQFIVITP